MALRQRIEEPKMHEQDGHHAARVARTATLVTLFPAEPEFTEIERTVIALARRDTLGSLEAPGLIERAFAWAFGLRTAARGLADPKLETLRRATVVTRHRHHLPDAVAADLRRLGYGSFRIRELERLALAD